MNKVRQVEDALELSLLALGAAYHTIKATGDDVLIGYAEKAISTLRSVTHDPDDDDIPMPYWRSLVCPEGTPHQCPVCDGGGTCDGESHCPRCEGWGMIFRKTAELKARVEP